MLEDDLIARAIRQLAAALAGTSAAEVRADGQREVERADAALGRIRDALARGANDAALREIDRAIGDETQLPPSTALRIDARSLAALGSSPSARVRLASLFALRAEVLRSGGRDEEAVHAEQIHDALAGAPNRPPR